MQKIAQKDINVVIEALLRTESYKAEKYITDKLVIRATRRTYKRKIRASENIEILLVIGKPNFEQREFIKDCKKAKEKFPIKGIILKDFPVTRTKKK